MLSLHTILHPAVQQFLLEHAHAEFTKIALQKKGVQDVPPQLLAEQLKARQKIKGKAPVYYQTADIVYPPSLNLEQSSSQATAKYKADCIADFFNKPISVVDLTGGFGIDSFFLSKKVESLLYIEPNHELTSIAQHNHRQLGAINITHKVASAEEFLITNSSYFDLLYLDPSRRNETRKVHRLEDCLPNVLELKSTLFKHTKHVVVKTSPLLDISATIIALGCVQKVYVVSVENECREVLYWCSLGFSDEPLITAVTLSDEGEVESSFSFLPSEERMNMSFFSPPLNYLYEPNASILKAGAFRKIANAFGLFKLAISTHLYTSSSFIGNFPGRVFKLDALVKADAKSIEKLLPAQKANVLTRNYPLSAESLKKKLKLNDGGEKYLFAFSSELKKHLALCTRLV